MEESELAKRLKNLIDKSDKLVKLIQEEAFLIESEIIRLKELIDKIRYDKNDLP